MSEPRIFMANIADLKPSEENPRKIGKAELNRLAEKMKKYPKHIEAREVVIDENFKVLGGHQRIKAAIQNGKDQILVKQVFGWTEEEKREFIINDNIAEGEWDDEKLKKWDEAELEGWGAPVDWEEEPAEVVEDDAPEVDETVPVESKLGEIYQLGGHRLMCGDSTDAASVALLMNGEKADMVFTDPPYGVSIGDKNAALNSVQKAGRCTTNIEGDTLDADSLYPVLVKAMTNVRENCKDDASYFVTSPQGGSLGLMMMMMMKDAGLEVRHVLMWVKNVATFSLGRLDYDYQHEPMFYTWTKSHHNYRKGKFRTTLWEVDKPRKCDLHPTMKPIELIANALDDTTKEGDVVLDVFGGSGSTLIACEERGRKARLMEIDPKYCDVIRKRYWKFVTGSEEGWQDGTKAVA